MNCGELSDLLFLLCCVAYVPYLLLTIYLVSPFDLLPGGRLGFKGAWWPFNAEMKEENPRFSYWGRISLYLFFVSFSLLVVVRLFRLC